MVLTLSKITDQLWVHKMLRITKEDLASEDIIIIDDIEAERIDLREPQPE